MNRLFFVVYMLMTVTGCSHLKFWEKSNNDASTAGEDGKVVESVGVPAALSPKDLDLKIAELNSRIQELENENIRQKEKLYLIRKAVVLGIVPDDLKNQFYEERDSKPMADKPRLVPSVTEKNQVSNDEENVSKSRSPVPMPAKEPEKIVESKSREEVVDEKSYQQKLAHAQTLFGAAKYGEAIAAYSAIGRDFPPQMTKGHHYYWIGLSWFYLKEYEFAQKNFQEVMSGNSPLLPKAKYFMAKIEARKGLKETAVQHFRSVITEYPQDEAAEMAKAEIKQLEESL